MNDDERRLATLLRDEVDGVGIDYSMVTGAADLGQTVRRRRRARAGTVTVVAVLATMTASVLTMGGPDAGPPVAAEDGGDTAEGSDRAEDAAPAADTAGAPDVYADESASGDAEALSNAESGRNSVQEQARVTAAGSRPPQDAGLTAGILEPGDDGCLLVRTGVDHSRTQAVAWPEGWTVADDADGVRTLYDAGGAPVARAGYELSLRGYYSAGPVQDRCGSSRTFVATSFTGPPAPADRWTESNYRITQAVAPIVAEHPALFGGFRWGYSESEQVVVRVVDRAGASEIEDFESDLRRAVDGLDDDLPVFHRKDGAFTIGFDVEPAAAPLTELEELAEEVMDSRADWASDPALVYGAYADPLTGSVVVNVATTAVATDLIPLRRLPSGAWVKIELDDGQW